MNTQENTGTRAKYGIGFRIMRENRTYVNAGTRKDSWWFTLEEARQVVNYEAGETIVEHDGERKLWEIF